MKLLLYDGTCNLCHWAVKWVRKNSRPNIFQFEALDSDFGIKILEKHPALKGIDSIIFLDEKGIYVKSKAVFKICGYLNGGWKWLQIFNLIPTALLDYLYTFIAKHRKRWFGEATSCTF